jgi:hypothetical protein
MARYCRSMTLLRPLFGLILSLVLAATSLTAAEMRGHAIGSRLVEICSDSAAGSNVTTILLDAKGNPIAPMHPCPDCTVGGGLAVLLGGPIAVAPLTTVGSIAATLTARDRTYALRPPAHARAPPLTI